jgi:hypothetical protein
VPLQLVFCGAKFAIRGFLYALRSELYHDKIKVPVTVTEMDLPAVNTRNSIGRGTRWAARHGRRRRSTLPDVNPATVYGFRVHGLRAGGRRSYPTHEPNNEQNEQNCSEYATTDIHVILH